MPERSFFSGRRFWGPSLLLLGAALALPVAAQAQATIRRHLVEFRNKTGTPYTVGQPLPFLSPRAVARRQRQQIAVQPRDLPPTPAYVQQVDAIAGVTVIYRTRWFNGVVVECDSAHLAQIRALAFVRAAQTLKRGASAGGRPAPPPTRRPRAQRPTSPNPYGIAFAQAEQIGATTMHAAGFRGEGMQVAIFDAGFPGVDTIAAFQALRSQGRLLSTFDVVEKDNTVFDTHPHGTWVLSTMAGYLPNAFIGTAPNASYHLVRTEDTRGNTETLSEEVNWLIGAEYADSVGVDVINSSLGYTTFDLPWQDHTYADLDGHTAIGTRAADLAAAVGILVVNSAGNEGTSSWQYIGVPADGDSVLAVGAVDSLGNRASFSSIGPTADGRIKPDVSAQGLWSAIIDPSGFISRGNGTSFAGPIMAGMVTGFLQANPTLTAAQALNFIKQSGSQAASPDNLLGYGIPDFRRAYNLAHPGAPLGLPPGEGRSVPELYPNPVPGTAFALRLPKRLLDQTLTVRLTDPAGRTVSEQEVRAAAGTDSVAISIDKNALRSGVYLCVVRAASGEQHTLRFFRN